MAEGGREAAKAIRKHSKTKNTLGNFMAEAGREAAQTDLKHLQANKRNVLGSHQTSVKANFAPKFSIVKKPTEIKLRTWWQREGGRLPFETTKLLHFECSA